jgi:hypothetical protein
MTRFLKLPTTIVEWIVIALIAIGACVFFFSPYMDDGVTAARKKQADAERAAQSESATGLQRMPQP